VSPITSILSISVITSKAPVPHTMSLGRFSKAEIGTSDIFIVVDALDECIERDQEYLITELQSLASTVHVMVTSRPLPSIEQLFHGATRLEIHATKDDVRKYIDGQISREHRLALLVKGITPCKRSSRTR
jgi:hypothetical protein